MNEEDFYRRSLPHWQPKDAEYFITFRLTGSLPRQVVIELSQLRKTLRTFIKNDEINSLDRPRHNHYIQQKIFKKYEAYLDRGTTGPTWLSDEAVATIIKEALHHRMEKNMIYMPIA